MIDFLTHEKLTAREIAEKYDISKRTAYRYLNDISLYLPIYSTSGKYRLIEGELKDKLRSKIANYENSIQN